MKIDFKKIKEKFKKSPKFEKMNPHRHWVGLLNLFFIVITILILFSFFLLYKIKTQQIFQVKTNIEPSPSIINEKLLNRVNEFFNDKSTRRTQIETGVKIYQDPSF